MQRHQKISRISVKNENYVSTDAKQLEQIQEDQRRFNSRQTTAPKSIPSIGVN